MSNFIQHKWFKYSIVGLVIVAFGFIGTGCTVSHYPYSGKNKPIRPVPPPAYKPDYTKPTPPPPRPNYVQPAPPPSKPNYNPPTEQPKSQPPPVVKPDNQFKPGPPGGGKGHPGPGGDRNKPPQELSME